jgi:hypothetical protein
MGYESTPAYGRRHIWLRHLFLVGFYWKYRMALITWIYIIGRRLYLFQNAIRKKYLICIWHYLSFSFYRPKPRQHGGEITTIFAAFWLSNKSFNISSAAKPGL